jgi:purine catabolism regulator
MITVRDALSIGELKRATLVAGEAGLDAPISCVDIMEVPDVTGWIRPHEFVITCAYALRDDPEGQVRLVRRLAADNAAALAVKPSRFLGAMPTHMIAAANEVGLPLIDVPPDVPFIDITHPLVTALLNDAAPAASRTADIQGRMVSLVLEGTGMGPVVRELGRMLGRSVHVVDHDLRVLATTDESEPPRGPQSGVEVFPVVGAGNLMATLLVEPGSAGPLSETERTWAEQAAVAVGLEMLRLRAIRETEFRLRSDFLGEVLRGEQLTSESTAAKARMLGIELDRPYVVMVASHDGDESSGACDHLLRKVVCREHDRSGERAGLRISYLQYEGKAVYIITGIRTAAAGEVLALADSLIQVSVEARAPLSIGISEQLTGSGSLALAYSQASRALELGRAVYGPGKAVSYASLAPYLMLQKLDARALGAFAEAELGALRREGREGGVLLETLRAFLESGGELKSAAEKIFIHRNTLDYRLRRIEKILQYDIRDPETQFRLRLAMAAMILSKLAHD